MTNLPITTNLPSASAGNKPAAGDDSRSSVEQAFGAVLARQFADAAGGNADQLGKVLSKLGDALGKSDQAADPSAATASASIPADMLATLLAQHAIVKDVASPADAASTPTTASNDPAQLAQQQAAAAMAMPVAAGTAAQTVAAPSAANMNSLASASLSSKTQAPLTAQADQARTTATPNPQGQPATSPADFSQALQALERKPATSLGAGQQTAQSTELTSTANLPPVAAAQGMQHLQAASASAAPMTVSTPVGQAGWDHELGQKITWIASQRDHSAELHLNPPQLGPLDVTLKVSGDQATAVFASPHAAVRDAIEQALPKLREMLADSGIMLGNATVNDQTTRKEQEPSARPQYDSAGTSGSAVSDHQTGSITTTISRHNGMVDTFA